nr:MAG TPA: tail tubular protein [Caudoviricetes sp.]
MKISKIYICNLALANLGQAPINALTDENERARKCELFYEVALGETLRAHPWKFAETTAPLALLAAEAPGWKYVYKYPADAAHVQRVTLGNMPVGFHITAVPDFGRVILCNAREPYAVYTRHITDPSEFDECFVRVFAWTLACDLALPLTQDSALMQQAQNQKLMELDKAQYTNREEGDTVARYACSYLPGALPPVAGR